MRLPTDTELPGAAERAAPGPVHHHGPGPAIDGWLDPRGRALGGRAFALHRLTGLALVAYLYIHLGVLSMLLVGQSSWNTFLSTVSSKGFLSVDLLLIFGLLFHGLNGIRVALVGSGVAVPYQRAIVWVAAAIGTGALIFAGLHIYGAI